MLVLGHAQHSSGWQKRPLVKVSSRTHFLTRPQQDLKNKNVYCGFSHRFSLIKKKLEISRSSLLSAMYVRWIHSIVCNGASPAAQDRSVHARGNQHEHSATTCTPLFRQYRSSVMAEELRVSTASFFQKNKK